MRSPIFNMRILLAISFLLNIIIAYSAFYKHFENEQEHKVHMQNIYSFRTTFFDAYPLSRNDIVMLGDSITQAGNWAEMIPHLPIRNRGISGDQTSALLKRLDDITVGQPVAVFLKIGTNDLGLGVSPDESYLTYRKIVTKILTESPGTTLYLQSLLPRSADYKARIIAYNLEIKNIAVEFGLPYIDLYTHFLDSDGSIKDTFSHDELHLTGKGYRLWQDILTPYMNALS